jgi:hypothetical protein
LAARSSDRHGAQKSTFLLKALAAAHLIVRGSVVWPADRFQRSRSMALSTPCSHSRSPRAAIDFTPKADIGSIGSARRAPQKVGNVRRPVKG